MKAGKKEERSSPHGRKGTKLPNQTRPGRPLTCAGAEAGVVSQQPLLLEHSFQVHPERSLVLALLGLPPASLRLPLSVRRILQRLLDLLLPLLVGQAARGRRPIDAQRPEEGNDVAVLGEHRAVGHCKSDKGEETVSDQLKSASIYSAEKF